MALIVDVLALLTSLVCALLLLRAWRQSRVPLLMWSGLAFVCFTLNNLGLLVDLYLTPGVDLSHLRTVPSLVGVALLLGALIWNAK
jgi:hypothetical protein